MKQFAGAGSCSRAFGCALRNLRHAEKSTLCKSVKQCIRYPIFLTIHDHVCLSGTGICTILHCSLTPPYTGLILTSMIFCVHHGKFKLAHPIHSSLALPRISLTMYSQNNISLSTQSMMVSHPAPKALTLANNSQPTPPTSSHSQQHPPKPSPAQAAPT